MHRFRNLGRGREEGNSPQAQAQSAPSSRSDLTLSQTALFEPPQDPPLTLDFQDGDEDVFKMCRVDKAGYLTNVPDDMVGHFFPGDTYVIFCSYKTSSSISSTNKEVSCLSSYIWHGKMSQFKTEDDAVHRAIAASYKNEITTQIKITQGNEPCYFRSMFYKRNNQNLTKNIIIHDGGSHCGRYNCVNYRIVNQAFDIKQSLFQIKINNGNIETAYTIAKPKKTSSLDSRDCFILCTNHGLALLWMGKYTSEEERAFGHYMAGIISGEPMSVVKMPEDVNVMEEFWSGLEGGRNDYNSSSSSSTKDVEETINENSKPGILYIAEGWEWKPIGNDYTAADLKSSNLLVLDCGFEGTFVWVGSEKKEATGMFYKAVECLDSIEAEDFDTRPIIVVNQDFEHDLFTMAFRLPFIKGLVNIGENNGSNADESEAADIVTEKAVDKAMTVMTETSKEEKSEDAANDENVDTPISDVNEKNNDEEHIENNGEAPDEEEKTIGNDHSNTEEDDNSMQEGVKVVEDSCVAEVEAKQKKETEVDQEESLSEEARTADEDGVVTAAEEEEAKAVEEARLVEEEEAKAKAIEEARLAEEERLVEEAREEARIAEEEAANEAEAAEEARLAEEEWLAKEAAEEARIAEEEAANEAEAAEEARLAEEAKAVEEARLAEEEAAEEARIADEESRIAEEEAADKVAEEARLAEESRVAEEEAATKIAAVKAAEEARIAEEEEATAKVAEEARIAEEEAAAKIVEEARVAEEEAAAKAAEEEAAVKIAEEARVAEEEAVTKAAEETRIAEEEAAAKVAEEEAVAKAAEEARIAEEEAIAKIAEETRIAEEEAAAKAVATEEEEKEKEVADASVEVSLTEKESKPVEDPATEEEEKEEEEESTTKPIECSNDDLGEEITIERTLSKSEESTLPQDQPQSIDEKDANTKEEKDTVNDDVDTNTKDAVVEEQNSEQIFYTLDELKKPINGVEWAKREEYLSNEDFITHFGMQKESFKSLPMWKRQSAKKKNGIF